MPLSPFIARQKFTNRTLYTLRMPINFDCLPAGKASAAPRTITHMPFAFKIQFDAVLARFFDHMNPTTPLDGFSQMIINRSNEAKTHLFLLIEEIMSGMAIAMSDIIMNTATKSCKLQIRQFIPPIAASPREADDATRTINSIRYVS